jgi:hypothetical protein
MNSMVRALVPNGQVRPACFSLEKPIGDAVCISSEIFRREVACIVIGIEFLLNTQAANLYNNKAI